MAGGRPSKYDPAYCSLMIEWFENSNDWAGVPTFEKYAYTIGVSVSTLRKWKTEHEEFSAAYASCKDLQLHMMFEGAIVGELHAGFTMFAMKNMHNWRDKIEQENINQTIQVNIDAADADL